MSEERSSISVSRRLSSRFNIIARELGYVSIEALLEDFNTIITKLEWKRIDIDALIKYGKLLPKVVTGTAKTDAEMYRNLGIDPNKKIFGGKKQAEKKRLEKESKK